MGQTGDMTIAELVIDVDTHVTEPPDTFVSRVPAKFKDRVPRVERTKEGKDHWFVSGEMFSSVGMTAVAGWPEPFPNGPSVFEEIHPAAYDASERLKLMDEQGIWAQVLYPNVGGFGAQHFLKLKDRELMLACVQAYNNFQLDWISPDPRRFVAVVSTPFWDIDDTVAEVNPVRRTRPPRGAVHRRAAAVRAAPSRRSPLGSPLVGGPGGRAAHQPPYRQRRHHHRLHPRADGGPRQALDLCLRLAGDVPQERHPAHRPAGVRRATSLPRSQVRVGGERHRLHPLRARSR